MKQNVLLLIMLLWLPFLGSTQTVIPIDTTLGHFVKTALIGAKQSASNIQGNYDQSIGVFYDFGDTELGLEHGVILSTGRVMSAIGPNKSGGMGFALGLGSDTTLAALSGAPLLDATSIVFDFVPFTNEISFDYVFASEEYPEYVNSQFNDIFGFFVSGPGIDGEKNIALLPDGSSVSINNVNHLTNSQWFKNNTTTLPVPPVDTAHIEYDGFTIPLTAKVEVTPFQTYRLKIVIADAYDNTWDSAIFLKENSFRSKPLVFNFDFTEGEYFQTIYENDHPLEITAQLPNVAKQDITYHFTYSGDAELGQDFLAPESFTFKQGETVASFLIEPVKDKVLEGPESILLIIDETQDTLNITLDEQSVVPVADLAQSNRVLYPNPTQSTFGLSEDADVEQVTIYTLAGKRVKEFRSDFERMNVDDVAKGLYAVHIVTNDGLIVNSLKIE